MEPAATIHEDARELGLLARTDVLGA